MFSHFTKEVNELIKLEIDKFAKKHKLSANGETEKEKYLALIAQIKEMGYKVSLEKEEDIKISDGKAITEYRVKFKSL
ncbi:MAG TPA: hypothetical protein IAA29_00705 [Candidatus Paenibacillus intestinavium]|nr:hypothetical protein [Candidatus Paenibacillus intestinavium]